MRESKHEQLSEEMRAEIQRRMGIYIPARKDHAPKIIAADMGVSIVTVWNVWNAKTRED